MGVSVAIRPLWLNPTLVGRAPALAAQRDLASDDYPRLSQQLGMRRFSTVEMRGRQICFPRTFDVGFPRVPSAHAQH